MREKVKTKENVSNYKNFTRLFTMSKEKSPCTVVFCYEEDEFLVHVIKHKTKTGVISESSIILAPEIDNWIEIYRKEGFKKNN
jgi:hypothetical protein